MTAPDYFTVEWSPTRGAAIVRDTNGGEYPYDECDEAAHQLLACGNLARRMNTKPGRAPEPIDCERCGHPLRDHVLTTDGSCACSNCPAYVSVTHPPHDDALPVCANCGHTNLAHVSAPKAAGEPNCANGCTCPGWKQADD